MRGIGVVHELPVWNEMDSGYHVETKDAGRELSRFRLGTLRKTNLCLSISELFKRGLFRERSGELGIPLPLKAWAGAGFAKTAGKL
jgi:hypothetical protein